MLKQRLPVWWPRKDKAEVKVHQDARKKTQENSRKSKATL